ncbi:2OG-Fe dioxygenase family protein [Acinetobacter sp. NIPH1876]|uniref:2OG-Fe dioxygenase family protein n=1 Tax=unclassified Acinetobacter TaxID=196816 RepID=UPI001FAC1D99|nr:2OG-Fe dioxygenase family protein [Acinetobacter sp. NIPH1876]MCJ0829389.1 2OG-Fe dioxygenase family protein [Acinetobacter sp. NIPH1876]
MLSIESNEKEKVINEIKEFGFSNVTGKSFSLSGGFLEFIEFSQSWENMPEDIYFGQKDSGRRFRRYSDFDYDPVTKKISQLEHRLYHQSTELNKYVGGKDRHFGDFETEIIKHPILKQLIDINFEIFSGLLDENLKKEIWQCQIHQIRIEIYKNKTLEITPEGIHSDGYPYSGVHFWGRENVNGAESQLFDKDKNQLAATTYSQILDTTFFLDKEMLHYVTPTTATQENAYRQIIAVSFSRPGTDYATKI